MTCTHRVEGNQLHSTFPWVEQILSFHVSSFVYNTRWHDKIIVWGKKLLLCCQDQPSDDFVHLKNLSTGGALRQGWLFSDSGLRDICPTIWHSHNWTGAQIWYLSELKFLKKYKNAIIASEKLLHNALKEGALCQKHFRFNLESPVEHPSFIEN